MAELTAPFVLKNAMKRIVFGPVLVPDEPDSDEDVVSKEKIEEVAYTFMEQYGNIDLQHSLNNVGKVVESYILPFDWNIDDEYIIPAGSWMMGVKVQDDTTWALVEAGSLTGFSIMGVSKKNAVEKNKAVKRTTLADLEASGDWIVNAVSLVDEPAVPKAKFIAIKSKDERSKIVAKALAGSLEHRRALIQDKVYSVFENENNSVYLHSTMPDYVIMEVYDYETSTEKKFKVNYSISEAGEVTFTSAPVEVEVQEVIVNKNASQKAQNGSESVSEGEEGGKTSKSKKSENQANKSLFERFKEKLGFKSVENEEGDEEMKKEEIQAMIDESMKSIEDKVSEIMSTLKGLDVGKKEEEGKTEPEKEPTEKGAEAGESEEKAEKSEKETDEEEASYKAKYEAIMKEFEKYKQKVPFSKRLTGQDGMSTEKAKDDEFDRDPFGFKRKA